MLNPATLALLGGNEFTENCVIADKKILETVGKDNPIIRILPTANEHHPDIAAQNGKPDMVEYLLRKGASTDIVDLDGKNAVNVAKDNKHEDIVKMLGERGQRSAKPHAGDGGGESKHGGGESKHGGTNKYKHNKQLIF